VNDWAIKHGLADKRVALYSGTLGLKHNPELILEAARRVRERGAGRLVVVSEGAGADWLKQSAHAEGLEELIVLPFQSYEDLPDVMASADVLLAILEPAAGAFSVPSKILSYHCAGRPIVASIPAENLATRILAASGGGVVVPPGSTSTFAEAVVDLLCDEERCNRLGSQAREWAERTFAIRDIADSFEHVVATAATTAASARRGLASLRRPAEERS
jgi:glycosyltransferase involved in cell wall biosynthesis